MKKKIFITIITLLCVSRIFGQEQIWIQQTKVSDAIAFEKKINPNVKFLSQNESLSKDYYPLADKYKVTKPIIAQRETIGELPVYAAYFYTANDSILRLISYDWEKNRYGNLSDLQKTWEEESKKFRVYNKEYERIRTNLTEQFGEPTIKDKKAKKVKSKSGSTYINRETIWETEDRYAELSLIFASMTYRVRLTLYWKN